MARRLDVSESMVSQWVTGRRCPSLAVLHQIADALGVLVYELFVQQVKHHA